VAVGVGRVLVGGRDAGAGVALGPRTVVTASHVLARRAGLPVAYQPADGGAVAVEAEAMVDVTLDAAALRLGEDLGGWLPVAPAVEGDDWVVESPPPGNDPTLSGTISDAGLRIENASGVAVEVLQLRVDQLLGDYRGYSGSGVLDRRRRAVVGLLVEQKHLRLPAPVGRPRPASNVLYAVPIGAVVERLGLPVAAARPRRLGVEAVLADTVPRHELLDRLVQALTGAGQGGAVRVWGLGGMGKTTLVRQALHDPRVWRAFPGGIVMVTAGEHASGQEVLAELASRLGVVGLEVGEALAGDPALVVVDDVWSRELAAAVAAGLPGNAVLAVTTRGTPLEPARTGRAVASVHVGELRPEEAIGLLARDVPHSAELDRALGELASALGHWPLLLSLAAGELHGDELQADEPDGDLGPEPTGPAARSPAAAAEAAAAARRLVEAFARDPTKLDDPDSQQRSFARMVERSLGRLSAESRDRFLQLAAYPAAAELVLAALADLWQVDELDGRRTVRGLRRVGLVGLVADDPVTIRLHDQLVAWLHHTRGAPDAVAHRDTHRRLAALASGPDGGPGRLTPSRAAWLAFHLCRTGVAADPGRLLGERWASAYRRAAGGRATYLAALREVVGHWGWADDGLSPGPSSDDLARWMLLGGLLHAGHAALVAEVPGDALVAEALLGRTAAALRQAVDDPEQVRAARTLANIIDALARRQALTPRLVELAVELVDRLRNNVAQVEALRGLSSALAEHRPEMADHLLDRAQELVEQIQFGGDRARTLALLAEAERDRDPDHARRLLDRALEVAERLSPAQVRDAVLADVAAAVAGFDLDRALELARSLGHNLDEAMVGIASAVAARDPERAAGLVEEVWELHRDRALGLVARQMGRADPERASALADRIDDDVRRGWALAAIAGELAPEDPDGALVLLDRAVKLAPGRPDVLASAAATLAPLRPEQAQALLDRALDLAEGQQVRYDDGPARMVSVALRRTPEVLDRVPDEWLPHDELGHVAAAMLAVDRGRARRLVDRAAVQAERRAAEPYGLSAGGLALVGAVMLAFDPGRADELLGRAVQQAEQDPLAVESADVAAWLGGTAWPGARPFLEREARRVAEGAGFSRDYTLGQLGAALAHTDPAAAVRLAEQTTGDDHDRSRALTMVATTILATDPAWGRRLLDQAAHLAEGAAGGLGRDLALREAAAAILPADPARAVELAEQVVDLETRMEAFTGLATDLLDTDPEQAAAVAARIDDWARRGRIGGLVALVAYRTGPEPALARLRAALGLVWWDADAVLWFAAGWLESTYPTATPPAAATGLAVVDLLSRFAPARLVSTADVSAVDGNPGRREEPEGTVSRRIRRPAE
jgi:hypothetical protein